MPGHERAGDVERLRRRHDPLRPLRVRGRVHLFGRDVRHVPHAGARVRRAALLREPGAREEADGEVGARAGEVERIQVERVEAVRHLPDLVDPLPPGRGGIGLVQPADVDDVLPQLLERLGGVQVRIDRLGPAPRREGGERPRDGAVFDHLEDLRHRREPVEPGAGRVDAVEEPRRDHRHEHGAGRVEVAEVEHPPPEPRRHPLERPVGRPLGPDPFHGRVEVEDVDVPRAAAVRRPGDLGDERLRLRQRLDGEHLVGLDVRADRDDQVRVAREDGGVHAADRTACGSSAAGATVLRTRVL